MIRRAFFQSLLLLVRFTRMTTYYISLLLFLFIYLFTLYIVIAHGIVQGLYIALLVWSFFILCVPGGSSGIILRPIKILTGYSLPYTEIITFLIAILLNLYTYFFYQPIYFKSIGTHLLYCIISQPRELWIIPLSCLAVSFYHTFFGLSVREYSRLLHYTLTTLLALTSLMILILFSYKDLLIIINVQASL